MMSSRVARTLQDSQTAKFQAALDEANALLDEAQLALLTDHSPEAHMLIDQRHAAMMAAQHQLSAYLAGIASASATAVQ